LRYQTTLLSSAGFIESWGRGIEKVRIGCEENGNPMVTFMLKESGMMVRLDLTDWWPQDLTAYGDQRPDERKPDEASEEAQPLWPGNDGGEPDNKSDNNGILSDNKP